MRKWLPKCASSTVTHIIPQVRLAAVAENSFNSVERVSEYAEVASENVRAPRGAAPPPSDWPARGGIVFDNVSMTYRSDLPPVLTDLSFEAAPAEKIGIVGALGHCDCACMGGAHSRKPVMFIVTT